MVAFTINDWSAWAPGINEKEAWKSWFQEKTELTESDTPKIPFIPAMQRRRCNLLSKMALKVAYDVCDESELSQLNAVFASRFGEMQTTISLIESILNKEAVSPFGFSHSVHNTPASQFSIGFKNKENIVSLSGGKDTFVASLLEALGLANRSDKDKVLLVNADEPLPGVFEPYSQFPEFPYAGSLKLNLDTTGGEVLELEHKESEVENGVPRVDFLRFIEWYLGDKPSLIVPFNGSTWMITRK